MYTKKNYASNNNWMTVCIKFIIIAVVLSNEKIDGYNFVYAYIMIIRG